MRKLNCRLIVSDYDGTLIDDKQQIPKKVRSAIDEYVENGGIFAVCTGRMPNSILPRVRAMGLKGLVVAYQGTIIAEIESGNLIKCGGFSHTDIAAICREIEKERQSVVVYSGEKLYTDIPSENEYLKLYEKIIGVEAATVEGKISEFVEKYKIFGQKVASLVHKNERDALYKALKERIGENYDVTCSASVLVEISPKEDNKGKALEFLADYYKIPRDKTVGIGDNLNDLPMILSAGIGVAVGNAEQELKNNADYVSCTNNEGAVAEIIDKFGFA